jgi:hypothetical protein
MKNNKSGLSAIEAMIVIVIVALVLAMLVPGCQYIGGGCGSFGPTTRQIVTVETKHVDSGESSHYMVGTDAGVFEVQNGFFLGIYDADDVYAKLRIGGRYQVTTKGNRVVNFWLKEYPYIVSIEELSAPKK